MKCYAVVKRHKETAPISRDDEVVSRKLLLPLRTEKKMDTIKIDMFQVFRELLRQPGVKILERSESH